VDAYQREPLVTSVHVDHGIHNRHPFERGTFNHLPGENKILPALGWGNLATLLRGFLIGFLAGFLFSP